MNSTLRTDNVSGHPQGSNTRAWFEVETPDLKAFTVTLNGASTSPAQPTVMAPHRRPFFPGSKTSELEAAEHEIASRRPMALELLPSRRLFDDEFKNSPVFNAHCNGSFEPPKHRKFASQCITLQALNKLDQSKINRLVAEDTKYRDDASLSYHGRFKEPVTVKTFVSHVKTGLTRAELTNSLYNEYAFTYYQDLKMPEALGDPSIDGLIREEFRTGFGRVPRTLETGLVVTDLSKMNPDQIVRFGKTTQSMRQGLSHYTDTEDEVRDGGLLDDDGRYPTLRQVHETLLSEFKLFEPKYAIATQLASKLPATTLDTEELSTNSHYAHSSSSVEVVG